MQTTQPCDLGPDPQLTLLVDDYRLLTCAGWSDLPVDDRAKSIVEALMRTIRPSPHAESIAAYIWRRWQLLGTCLVPAVDESDQAWQDGIGTAHAGEQIYSAPTYEINIAELAFLPTRISSGFPVKETNLPNFRRYGKIGLTSSLWEKSPSRKCHTQGVHVGRTQLVTSCVTTYSDNTAQRGLLQMYDMGSLTNYEGGSLTGGSNPMVGNYLIYDQPYAHAAVGQGVVANVNHVAGGVDSALFPVVADTNKAGEDGIDPVWFCPSRIGVFNQYAERVYEFCHEPVGGINGDTDVGLDAGAMIDYDGDLYVVATNKRWLYVYRLHGLGHWPLRPVGHERVFALRMAGNVPLWPSGSSDGVHWYQAISLFHTTGAPQDAPEICMFASRTDFLDCWRIPFGNWDESAWGASTERLFRLEVTGVIEGMFHEGLGVRPFGNSSRAMEFWAAPWDYKREWCGNPKASRKCTPLYRFTYDFD